MTFGLPSSHLIILDWQRAGLERISLFNNRK